MLAKCSRALAVAQGVPRAFPGRSQGVPRAFSPRKENGVEKGVPFRASLEAPAGVPAGHERRAAQTGGAYLDPGSVSRTA